LGGKNKFAVQLRNLSFCDWVEIAEGLPSSVEDKVKFRRAIAGLFIFVALAVVAAPFLSADDHDACRTCGARRSRWMPYLIPVSTSVREGTLASYWKKDVDPKHEHQWVKMAFNTPWRHADCPANFHYRWTLEDDAAVAVLCTLPTRREQKAFMDDIWRRGLDNDKAAHDRLVKQVLTIRAMYEKNPSRRDWPKVLKRLGMN
jgi:hypothetical protein